MFLTCFRPRRVCVTAAPIVLLFFFTHPLRASSNTFNAANWAGYVVQYTGSGSSAQSGVANDVSVTWVVPTAQASLLPAASKSICQCAVWIGFDGFTDSSLVQLGTTSYYDAGTTDYYSWYENISNGNGSLPITQFNVQPGDSITASIQYNPPGNPGTYLLTLTDNTQNKPFSVDLTNSARRDRAEWIAEGPNNGSIEPLPYVGSVAFTNASATLGTESGPIDNPDWETWDVVMLATTKSSPPFADAMTPAPIFDSGSGSSATSSFVVEQIAPEPSSVVLAAATAASLGAIESLRRLRKRMA